ncbi:MAG: hypothetical protein BGO21_28155 [Dyadobacter sp. 50-39]|uniref:DUF2281 domain-containing protein n=1 Tax=Dyadobacter sp. 50-39 TaxID=1895756 RepID=UPI000959342A|nr:DUF2281 domain-containing protein [Dyadobacter sp. 50-39]OJV16740.1 MAG: hypothetical protein BGO21_28155 [Dyadobacter sp. 50-39]
MATTVKGIYEHVKVTLVGKPPIQSRTEVTVTFQTEESQKLKKRVAGVLTGKVYMSDDFDEPLDDLKDCI